MDGDGKVSARDYFIMWAGAEERQEARGVATGMNWLWVSDINDDMELTIDVLR